MNANWIEFPDNPTDKVVSESPDGKYIAFVSLEYDQCSCEETPGDGSWEVISFNNRHVNFDFERGKEEAENNPDAVLLSYFEHGLCRWDVAGEMNHYPDFRWDGVRYAGVWVPEYHKKVAEEKGLKEGSDERREWMVDQARKACELYTAWSNGTVYYISVSIFEKRTSQGNTLNLRSDYRFDDPIFCESIGGIYNINNEIETIFEELKDELENCEPENCN